jgi:quinol monooxygenase YgiN
MAPYTGPTLSLHVHITVAPENAELFLSHLKPCYDVVSAEPECIFFEVFQNPAAPGDFKFVETWNASPEWFQTVQLTKDYYKPYLAATEPLWIKPRTFEIWERMPGNAWISVKEGLANRQG